MLKFLIFFAVLSVLMFLIDRFIRKKYNIPKEEFIYRTVNKAQRIGEIIIIILAGAALLIAAVTVNFNYRFPVFIMLFCVYLFRAYMEQKHEPHNKRYLISLVGCVYVLLLSVAAYFWFPPLGTCLL